MIFRVGKGAQTPVLIAALIVFALQGVPVCAQETAGKDAAGLSVEPGPPRRGEIAQAEGTSSDADPVSIGYRLLGENDLSGAMRSFEEALKLHPRSAPARTGRGMVLARQDRLQEAEEALREALVMNPEPARTLYELGLVYERLGDPGRAAAAFREGIETFRRGQR